MAIKDRERNRNSHSKYNISNDVEKIKEALFDTSEHLRGKANEMVTDSVDNIKNQSKRVTSNVSNYTGRNPFKALGIAMFSGIVLGWLFKRK